MADNLNVRDLVIDELTWDPAVDPAAIGVAVTDGAVTLSGHVGSYAEKRAAEKAAKRVKGVIAVANELDVRLPSDHVRDDTDIAAAAATRLKWSSGVPDSVTATVHDGWLTLEGDVEWQYQRRAAEIAVRDLVGVRGITNLIQVTPRVSTADIRNRIEAAFRRSAAIDAERVKVTAEGGRVRLSGTVSSWAERAAAEHSAWAAPGVTAVQNDLVVQASSMLPI